MTDFSKRFTNFMPFIFEWEGGYDNDPDDPGGETKYGIDKRSHPHEDIKNLTKDRATGIYWESYWLPTHSEDLPTGVGEVLMNISVNAGRSRAFKWLQEIVLTTVDGVFGPTTLLAAKSFQGNLAVALLDRTEQHYRSIARGRLAKFLRGWLNRNNSLRKYVASL